mmetsp:Transcript_26512/g.39225  ORF Transcript_26512/g.39225 Transcript_26512/m.39225 type:complete len:83 (-) Transcript_26512:372-620(-)
MIALICREVYSERFHGQGWRLNLNNNSGYKCKEEIEPSRVKNRTKGHKLQFWCLENAKFHNPKQQVPKTAETHCSSKHKVKS